MRLGDAGLNENAVNRLFENAQADRQYEMDSGFFPSVVENISLGICALELAARYRKAIEELQ
ncbi:hypothetical protein RSPO_m00311 (plasmid) [Ralstonia solanacearum Po82]|uniref:Uncharacterized protein n=1 Tax=Ralstonia solanacearum (strain Po82) TaxID=1031711 RepID=F6G8C3_RALS8|nr:hypothetical protein RSPO_m00311 [Ralstonia solanacearum Po82]